MGEDGDADRLSSSLEDLADRIRSDDSPNPSDADSTKFDGRDTEEGFEFPGTESPTGRDADPTAGPSDAFDGSAEIEALLEVIGTPATLLLMGEPGSPTDHELCTRILSTMPTNLENLLLVSWEESIDERLTILRAFLDTLPRQTVILAVGDPARNMASSSIQSPGDNSITVTPIADPTDFMRIGITMSKTLSKWPVTQGNTAVCVHSLTAMLQLADSTERVFKFLNVLRGRLKQAGATGHFHLDPSVHDDRTIETIKPVFDEVLTHDDGHVTTLS